MSIRAVKGKVYNKIPVRNVIASTYDKSGLDEFALSLLDNSPEVRFISTGGTYKELEKIFNKNSVPLTEHLISMEKYSGKKQMEGDLVKSFTPGNFGGLLGERGNENHQEYLRGENADFIDMVIINLYPFIDVMNKVLKGEINPNTEKPYTTEDARGYIDIGGPSMLSAAAKNYLSCAAVSSPIDYKEIIKNVTQNGGCTDLWHRHELKNGVNTAIKKYYLAIEKFDQLQSSPQNWKDNVLPCYDIVDKLE
jgi:phosphoribosylaminoimidazolecarboxamide formyltransferase / IMP cyclohydrolase